MGLRTGANSPQQDPNIKKPTISPGIDDDAMSRAMKALDGMGAPPKADGEDPEITTDLLDDPATPTEGAADPAPEKKPEEAAPEVDPDGIALDTISERERRHWKAQKKLRDENQALRSEISEIKKMLEGKPAAPASSAIEEEISPEDEDILDTIEKLKKKSNKLLTTDQVQELLAKKEQEIFDKLKKERESEQYESSSRQAIQAFQDEIGSFVDKNEQNYPLTKVADGQRLILQVIQQDLQAKAKEYGSDIARKNMLTIEQAAKKVEAYLEKKFDTVLGSSHAAAKLQKKFANAGKDPKQLTPTQQSPTTLSNDHHGGPPAGELTEEERFKRAVAALDRVQTGT